MYVGVDNKEFLQSVKRCVELPLIIQYLKLKFCALEITAVTNLIC